MNKVINSLLFVFIFFFMIANVNAECSYQERKSLLNDAKNVDITVSPKEQLLICDNLVYNTGQTDYDAIIYSFDFTITNLPNTLFIKYYTDFDEEENYVSEENLNNGMFTFNDNNYTTFKTYYFEFKSNNNNCAGETFYTKKIVKPKYNNYSGYTACSDENFSKTKYCEKFITKDLNINEEQFYKLYNDSLVKDNKSNVDKKNKSFIKKYWYVLLILIIVPLIIVSIVLINRKRSEL